jgi:ribonuclease D
VKRLAAVGQTIAADLQLAAEVLVTRRVLEEIAAGRKACDALHGWRAALLAARLDAVD